MSDCSAFSVLSLENEVGRIYKHLSTVSQSMYLRLRINQQAKPVTALQGLHSIGEAVNIHSQLPFRQPGILQMRICSGNCEFASRELGIECSCV